MARINYILAICLIYGHFLGVYSNVGLLGSQDLDLLSAPPSLYWPNDYLNHNSTLDTQGLGCNFCGEAFYNEPPPDDIIFIPSPPMHPSLLNILSPETIEANRQQSGQCSFCGMFNDESEQLANLNKMNYGFGGFMTVMGSLIAITAVVLMYVAGIRKPRIIPSFARSSVFKSSAINNGNPHHPHHHHNHQHHHQTFSKNNPLGDPLPHPEVNMSDPCYLQTNRDKTLNSPIISDHVPHKKTAIPSKCWAQSGSIVNRTVRRVPNEYEIPSSRTNSTGASSAVYADAAYDQHHQGNGNARFFSPYNLHTYAEVREVPDAQNHFHTSSNSSTMLSETNYDNAVYPHQGNISMQVVPNGTVQMSDFNSMRPLQSVAYQAAQMNHHQTLEHPPNMGKITHPGQPIYEQPQQRAQVIITSNNQGVNPMLLNHRDRIHNVI